jgi:hypothetical protein
MSSSPLEMAMGTFRDILQRKKAFVEKRTAMGQRRYLLIGPSSR